MTTARATETDAFGVNEAIRRMRLKRDVRPVNCSTVYRLRKTGAVWGRYTDAASAATWFKEADSVYYFRTYFTGWMFEEAE